MWGVALAVRSSHTKNTSYRQIICIEDSRHVFLMYSSLVHDTHAVVLLVLVYIFLMCSCLVHDTYRDAVQPGTSGIVGI